MDQATIAHYLTDTFDGVDVACRGTCAIHRPLYSSQTRLEQLPACAHGRDMASYCS